MTPHPGQAMGRTLYECFDTVDSAFPPIAAHLRAPEGEDVDFVLSVWVHLGTQEIPAISKPVRIATLEVMAHNLRC